MKNKIFLLIIFLVLLFFSQLFFLRKDIGKEQAIREVTRLEDIKKYLKIPGLIIEATENDKDNRYWFVHAYSISTMSGDLMDHTATYRWYTVDKKSGEIVNAMTGLKVR